MGCDEIEIVKEFCCLGDMLERYNSTEKAVTSRIHAEWRKFIPLFGTLCSGILSRKLKDRLYKACMKSVELLS